MIETIACLRRFLLDTGVHSVLIGFTAVVFPVLEYCSASREESMQLELVPSTWRALLLNIKQRLVSKLALK